MVPLLRVSATGRRGSLGWQYDARLADGGSLLQRRSASSPTPQPQPEMARLPLLRTALLCLALRLLFARQVTHAASVAVISVVLVAALDALLPLELCMPSDGEGGDGAIGGTIRGTINDSIDHTAIGQAPLALDMLFGQEEDVEVAEPLVRKGSLLLKTRGHSCPPSVQAATHLAEELYDQIYFADVPSDSEKAETARYGMAEDTSIRGCGVDYSRMALYIPFIQIVVSAMLTLTVHYVVVWMDSGPFCVARSVSASALAGFVVACHPWRLGYARGSDAVFKAMQPAAFAWILLTTWRSLLRSCCVSDPVATHNLAAAWSWRAILFHACTAILLSAAVIRNANPRSRAPTPMVVCALCTIAAFPTSLADGSFEPCRIDSVVDVVLSYARTVVFVVTYGTSVYSTPPARFTSAAISTCSTLAIASSCWSLFVWAPLLTLSIVQVGSLIFFAQDAASFASPENATNGLQLASAAGVDKEHAVPAPHSEGGEVERAGRLMCKPAALNASRRAGRQGAVCLGVPARSVLSTTDATFAERVACVVHAEV